MATADGNGDPLADGGPLSLQHFCREQEKDHSVLSLLKSVQVVGTWGPRVLFLVTELVSLTRVIVSSAVINDGGKWPCRSQCLNLDFLLARESGEGTEGHGSVRCPGGVGPCWASGLCPQETCPGRQCCCFEPLQVGLHLAPAAQAGAGD